MTINATDRERGFRPLVNTTAYPVIIQTSDNRIQGNLHAGENERIKDVLNSTETFIALTEVQILDIHGTLELRKSDFLAINRDQIVWVIENKAGSSP